MALNPFAKAFLNQPDKLAALGVEVKPPPQDDRWQTDPKRVPMMYRAQVKGRCSLHDASKGNQNLDTWTEQWTYPVNGEARYQRLCPPPEPSNQVYRIEVAFPFRLFSNGGQDSIARPAIGKDGIPFLPGSSVKGLFLRACKPEQAARYCGQQVRQQGKLQHLPGTTPLRFHGAYPLGNWANRLVDLVHPQGNRQIGTQAVTKEGNPREESASASALISLYKPHLVFEFSSDSQVDWGEIQQILLKALQFGVGGKTSSGYGMGGNFPGKPPIRPATQLSFLLKGEGVSSLLRDGTPEFRVNTFKAALRGHMLRLLAGGVDREKGVEAVNHWFGSSKAPAIVKLIWQERQETQFSDTNQPKRNPTHNVNGMLYVDIQATVSRDKDMALLEKIVQFAYTMGGFGKSWRRIWHKTFMPEYHEKYFAIGCHWTSPDFDQIQTPVQLAAFLSKLYEQCCEYLNIHKQDAKSTNWREAWAPQQVAVYCLVGQTSKAIALFHDETFKTTLAIGGKNPGDDCPKYVSSVWHRMLPIGNNQYLEIVTVFHGNRTPWQRKGIDQLKPFLAAIEEANLSFTWGSKPPI